LNLSGGLPSTRWLGGQQTQPLHHFIKVGEYDLALEEIAGTLAQNTIAITDQERGDMLP
jgi:hypothetical protein